MYWLISFDPLTIALYFLETLVWMIGGWLIVSHAFKLRSTERMITGIATGFLLFIGLSNLLAHVLPIRWAFWASALLDPAFRDVDCLAIEAAPLV